MSDLRPQRGLNTSHTCSRSINQRSSEDAVDHRSPYRMATRLSFIIPGPPFCHSARHVRHHQKGQSVLGESREAVDVEIREGLVVTDHLDEVGESGQPSDKHSPGRGADGMPPRLRELLEPPQGNEHCTYLRSHSLLQATLSILKVLQSAIHKTELKLVRQKMDNIKGHIEGLPQGVLPRLPLIAAIGSGADPRAHPQEHL